MSGRCGLGAIAEQWGGLCWGLSSKGQGAAPRNAPRMAPLAAGQSPGPLQVARGVHGPTAHRGEDEAEMQRWEVTRVHVPLEGVHGFECVVPKDQLQEGGHRVGGGAGRQGHSSHGEWAVGQPGRKADPPTSDSVPGCRAGGPGSLTTKGPWGCRAGRGVPEEVPEHGTKTAGCEPGGTTWQVRQAGGLGTRGAQWRAGRPGAPASAHLPGSGLEGRRHTQAGSRCQSRDLEMGNAVSPFITGRVAPRTLSPPHGHG